MEIEIEIEIGAEIAAKSGIVGIGLRVVKGKSKKKKERKTRRTGAVRIAKSSVDDVTAGALRSHSSLATNNNYQSAK